MDIEFYLWGSIVFGSAIVLGCVLLVALLGMAWAPFAALICALVARTRGLSPYRYAVAGAMYSSLFLLPWVYLVTSMYGRTIPVILVRLTYVLLYGVWLCGSVLYTAVFTVFDLVPDIYSQDQIRTLLISLLFNSLTLIVSLRLLIYKSSRRSLDYGDSSEQDMLPGLIYILPFVCLLVWTVAPLAILQITQ